MDKIRTRHNEFEGPEYAKLLNKVNLYHLIEVVES